MISFFRRYYHENGNAREKTSIRAKFKRECYPWFHHLQSFSSFHLVRYEGVFKSGKFKSDFYVLGITIGCSLSIRFVEFLSQKLEVFLEMRDFFP